MLYQEKELQNDSGRPLSYDSFTDKKTKWLLLGSSTFCIFCIELSLHLPSFKIQGLQNMIIYFSLVQIDISRRHFNLNFAHHFVIY